MQPGSSVGAACRIWKNLDVTNDFSRPTVQHWIDGKPFEGSKDRLGDVYDPATGELTKRVAFASPADVDAAVSSAVAAFSSWKATTLTKRVQYLYDFRELLNARKDELAEIITSEHGKVRGDALGEITRALEVVEFACGIPHLLKGGYSSTVSTDVDVYSLHQPVGVAGIISPFNFPAMARVPELVRTWKLRLPSVTPVLTLAMVIQ